MLNHDNAVWLEQRPQSGIWGGLYSFPQSEIANIQTTMDQSAIGDSTITSQKTLIAFSHTFSHYHLDITPILLQLSRKPDIVMEGSRGLWYNLSQPDEICLAAPVKQLLHSKPFDIDSHI